MVMLDRYARLLAHISFLIQFVLLDRTFLTFYFLLTNNVEQKGGAIYNSGKAFDACTSQDNDSKFHGPDISTLSAHSSPRLSLSDKCNRGQAARHRLHHFMRRHRYRREITQCPRPTACASTPSAPRTSTASCAASLAAIPTASRPTSVPVAKRASTATALALELQCAPLCPIGTYNPVEGAAGPGSCYHAKRASTLPWEHPSASKFAAAGRATQTQNVKTPCGYDL